MTASIPYPGVTGVNIHAFTLCRGVLRHRQSRLTPHGVSRAVLFYPLRPEHLNLLMSIAPTDPSSTRSRTGSFLAENTDSPIPELRPVQYDCRRDANTKDQDTQNIKVELLNKQRNAHVSTWGQLEYLSLRYRVQRHAMNPNTTRRIQD
jgi:hypothetical protein